MEKLTSGPRGAMVTMAVVLLLIGGAIMWNTLSVFVALFGMALMIIGGVAGVAWLHVIALRSR